MVIKNQGSHPCPETVLGRWVWYPSRWLRRIVGLVDEGGRWYGGFTLSSSCPVLCLRSRCWWILEVPQGSLWSLRCSMIFHGCSPSAHRLFLHCCRGKCKLQIRCKRTNLEWNGKDMERPGFGAWLYVQGHRSTLAILKRCFGVPQTACSRSIPIQGDMLVEESTSKDDAGPLGRFWRCFSMHKKAWNAKKHQCWVLFSNTFRLKKVDLLILGSGFSMIREAEYFERCCVELATAPASGKEVAEALGGPISKVACWNVGNLWKFWGTKICLKTITALTILMFYSMFSYFVPLGAGRCEKVVVLCSITAIAGLDIRGLLKWEKRYQGRLVWSKQVCCQGSLHCPLTPALWFFSPRLMKRLGW